MPQIQTLAPEVSISLMLGKLFCLPEASILHLVLDSDSCLRGLTLGH